jgi:ArsR family transcriptional regulator, arsenate/arsenite/antimonite-responsive transcriptional repressor
MIHERNLALMFKVLAVTPRVRIIQLLKQRPLCVGALAVRLDITPGAVSQHLQVLRKAGLVKAEKCGYFMHYQLNQETLSHWKEVAGEFLTVPKAPVAQDFEQSAGGPGNIVKT